MRLSNPTDKIVSFTHRGTEYSIGPNSVSDELSEEVVRDWIKVHQFLQVTGTPEPREEIAVLSEDITSTGTTQEKVKEEVVKPKKSIFKKSK